MRACVGAVEVCHALRQRRRVDPRLLRHLGQQRVNVRRQLRVKLPQVRSRGRLAHSTPTCPQPHTLRAVGAWVCGRTARVGGAPASSSTCAALGDPLPLPLGLLFFLPLARFFALPPPPPPPPRAGELCGWAFPAPSPPSFFGLAPPAFPGLGGALLGDSPKAPCSPAPIAFCLAATASLVLLYTLSRPFTLVSSFRAGLFPASAATTAFRSSRASVRYSPAARATAHPTPVRLLKGRQQTQTQHAAEPRVGWAGRRTADGGVGAALPVPRLGIRRLRGQHLVAGPLGLLRLVELQQHRRHVVEDQHALLGLRGALLLLPVDEVTLLVVLQHL